MRDLIKRTSRYQRTIEDLIIEIEKERDPNGLLVDFNTMPLAFEFNKLMKDIVETRKNWEENPSKATLVAGPEIEE